MNTTKSQNWEPCPKGELSNVVRKIRASRRDKAVAQFVGVAGAFLILISAGALLVQQLRVASDARFGSIACSEVKARLNDYVAGNLDKQLSERIRVHLASCDACRGVHEKMTASRQTAHTELGPGKDPDSPKFRNTAIVLLEASDE